MTNEAGFPAIDSHLPGMTAFVSDLVQDYWSGDIHSWETMAERVYAFFTPEMLDAVDAVAPGWHAMSSYANGTTLVHVMCVFTGLLACREFQRASSTQQELMKWIVLFHDIAKEPRNGQRDYTHGFRSAAKTGAILPRVGFPVMDDYDSLFGAWFALTHTAIARPGRATACVHDNRKLPEIVDGIERLFGDDTPAALIVKTVLLHSSIDVLAEWPQAAPLTDVEVRRYVSAALFPLLKMMMLADNDGWALFDPSTKERHRQETLAAFGRLERLVATRT
jgi:hypothetical protein